MVEATQNRLSRDVALVIGCKLCNVYVCDKHLLILMYILKDIFIFSTAQMRGVAILIK